MGIVLTWISILFQLMGAGGGADEVASLRRNAQELLREGQPAKALVLLQKARELDSLQADIDHLMNQCRAKMGGWVAPDAGSGWNDDNDLAQQAVKRNPDSMYRVGLQLAQAENIPAALRLFQVLTQVGSPKPEHLKAYTNLRTRQESLVSFHRDLAERALLRGAVSEVLEERRNAFAIDPDSPPLRVEVENAEQSRLISLEAFRTSLRKSLAGGDAVGAFAVLAKARVAHPTDSLFRRAEDSLLSNKKEFVAKRLTEIDKMVDDARGQDAMEAMESLRTSFPDEPGLLQAQDALRERIVRKRHKDFADSLAKVFEKTMVTGDLQRAQSLVDELRAKQMGGAEIARYAARVDSARAKERAAAAFNDAFGNARKALVRGDTASAREWTQKALVVQPENTLAKGLLVSLVAQQKALANAAKKPPKPDPTSASDQSAKVNALVMAGISAYRGGDYKTAMERWKDALAIDPKCVQAERYMANVGRKQARLQ